MRIAWMLCAAVGLQAAQGQALRQGSAAGPESPASGAMAAAAQDNRVASIQSLRQAVAQDPANSALRLRLAAAYFRLGDLDHARREYDALHTAEPGNLTASIGLASTFVKMGRNQEAVDLLAPLEPRNAANLDLAYVLGFAQIESGHATEGAPLMETVARQQHSAVAYLIAGSARMYLKQYPLAKVDLEAAKALNPNLPGLQTLVGHVDYALGDLQNAALAFQQALRQNPQDSAANLYLGSIRLGQGDFADARPLLELALQLGPKVPLARMQMAKLDAMTGHSQEALHALEALEKDLPDWLDPHVELASLYYKLHRPADGARERQIVAELQAKLQQEREKSEK